MLKGRENPVEERSRRQGEEDEINVGELLAILRPVWWKVVLFSLAVGLVTLVVMFRFPNRYQATAVIAPPAQEKSENPAFGMLATLGVNVGVASKVEDLETLFKSNDLTVRVFRKYPLWPILYGNRYDRATGKLKRSWTSRLFGGKESSPPGDWDAIREAKTHLKVFVNRRAGTLSISFESTSKEGSADIVKDYLEEGKNRLQEEALDRAVKNKNFIEEQIGKTVDALTRDRLYSLYGQEVEREMMARNREQFGFRVIDVPRAPDKKSGPPRGFIALMATLFSGFVFFLYFVAKNRRKKVSGNIGTD
jgi:uncharacterized protein involved in exopolysaccharide biosynthesis